MDSLTRTAGALPESGRVLLALETLPAARLAPGFVSLDRLHDAVLPDVIDPSAGRAAGARARVATASSTAIEGRHAPQISKES